MEEIDLTQPAIVFWEERSGELTRLDRLGGAVRLVIRTPGAKTAPIAWIKTNDRHLEMDEIREIASRFSLTWRLSQGAKAVGDAAEILELAEKPRKKRFSWSETSLPQG
jgi:hypothetical protein